MATKTITVYRNRTLRQLIEAFDLLGHDIILGVDNETGFDTYTVSTHKNPREGNSVILEKRPLYKL